MCRLSVVLRGKGRQTFIELCKRRNLRGQDFYLSVRMLALFLFPQRVPPIEGTSLLTYASPVYFFFFLENKISKLVDIFKFSQTPKYRNVNASREFFFL